MYKAPKREANSFTCPYCKTVAEQKWDELTIGENDFGQIVFSNYGVRTKMLEIPPVKISISTCWNCKRYYL